MSYRQLAHPEPAGLYPHPRSVAMLGLAIAVAMAQILIIFPAQADQEAPQTPPSTPFGITIALEPSGGFYFIARDTPRGFGIGGRISVPVIWGFELAGGYQFVNVDTKSLPMVTHHAFGAVAYRLDDLRYVSFWGEFGVGYFQFGFKDQRRVPIDDVALHVGIGLDTFIFERFLLGAFVRYHIYPLTGLTDWPAGLAAGLRVGVRL